MSKIRVLIYRLDIRNLQTKIVSFPDQENFLKEVAFSIGFSMNVNTENSHIKHFPCPKHLVIYRPDLYNLQTRKTIGKMSKSYVLSFKICNHKKPPISTLSKNLRWSELRCITCRPDLYNLKTRKSLCTKMYLIVRIELSLNKNTLKGLKRLKYVFCNLKTFKLYN